MNYTTQAHPVLFNIILPVYYTGNDANRLLIQVFNYAIFLLRQLKWLERFLHCNSLGKTHYSNLMIKCYSCEDHRKVAIPF
jgi:hypothetical protein